MKVLFVTHEASRTGAPLVLLNFLRWIRDNSRACFEIVCLRRGEIVQEFEKLGRVHVIDEEPILLKAVRRLFGINIDRFSRLSILSRRLSSEGFDIIYANTVTSIAAAVGLSRTMKKKPKIILHVHEGHLAVNEFAPNFREYAPFIDQFIAASGLVASNLMTMGVDAGRIHVVYEFSAPNSQNIGNKPVERSERFTVGGSGLVNWRKGTELFILVANHCKLYFPEMELDFIWVGKVPEQEGRIIDEDLRKCALKNVRFVGQTENPEYFFQRFDLFLMTSREDPFPLVCIEAGQHSVPILCFEGATGTQEILIKGGGRIIPYMDIHSMALAIRDYYHDRICLKKDGESARVLFSEFTSEKICPIHYREISNLLEPVPTGCKV